VFRFFAMAACSFIDHVTKDIQRVHSLHFSPKLCKGSKSKMIGQSARGNSVFHPGNLKKGPGAKSEENRREGVRPY
jgi:hypothetical protein